MEQEVFLSRTDKDSRSKKTTRLVVEVRRNDNGTYELFSKGDLVASEVPDRWLDAELCGRFGLCGEEYQAIARQLNEFGKATVIL